MPRIKPRTTLYRNFDQEFDRILSRKSAERKITVNILDVYKIQEVVIHDPDYTRIPGDLQVLTDECKEYIAKNRLMKAPNYFKLWMSVRILLLVLQFSTQKSTISDSLLMVRIAFE